MSDAYTRAHHLGEQHGRNAVDWFIMDPMQRAGFEEWLWRIVKGMDDGDPEVLDSLPQPDLSGEWVDGWTPMTLAVEVYYEDGEDGLSELCDEYEDGFRLGVERRIYEAYTYYTAEGTA